MDDLDELLTPSHLLLGYRVLSLPDPPLPEDPDYNESENDLSRRMRHLWEVLEMLEEGILARAPRCSPNLPNQ